MSATALRGSAASAECRIPSGQDADGRRNDLEASLREFLHGAPHVSRTRNQDDAAHAVGFEEPRRTARILIGVGGRSVSPTRLDAEISLERVVHGAGLEREPRDENGQTGLLREVRPVTQSFQQ